jgi:hypothetical protein
MKRIAFSLAAGLLALAGTTSVYAHDSVGWSISIGSPGVYYAPPPVVYAPPPAVYYAPAPVYLRYYSPAPRVRYYTPRYYSYRNDWHHDRGHRGSHGWSHRR